MSTADTDAIRQRLANATPGPWRSDGQQSVAHSDDFTEDLVAVTTAGMYYRQRADAEFIAHAPADIAALLADNERLRAQNEAPIGDFIRRARAERDQAEAERDVLARRLAGVEKVADDLSRPFPDGVPDREGEAIAEQIRAALEGGAS